MNLSAVPNVLLNFYQCLILVFGQSFDTYSRNIYRECSCIALVRCFAADIDLWKVTFGCVRKIILFSKLNEVILSDQGIILLCSMPAFV